MMVDEYYETGHINKLDYYEKEIKKAENRLFSHGFLRGDTTVSEQLYNMRSENPAQDFVGIVLSYDELTKEAKIDVRNNFKPYSTIEILSPYMDSVRIKIGEIIDSDGNSIDAARHPRDIVTIKSDIKLHPYDMLRRVINE